MKYRNIRPWLKRQISSSTVARPKNKFMWNYYLMLFPEPPKIIWTSYWIPTMCPLVPKRNYHGLRIMANPNLGCFSKALVSNSPEMVTTDFGMTSCCSRAPSLPWLFSLAFTDVRWSIAYKPPTVKVFSLTENLLVISATAALLFNWSRWWKYDAFIESPLSPLDRLIKREVIVVWYFLPK